MLDNNTLREILKSFAPDVDADAEGVFVVEWRSTETFYRMTEEFVPVAQRLAYKFKLEASFPGKKAPL